MGNGDGTFLPPADYPSVADNAVTVRVADVTGGGNLDIVTANEGWAAVSVVPGNGAAETQPAEHLIIGEGTAGLAIADFDGDDKLDFAVTTLSGSGVAILTDASGAYLATVCHEGAARLPSTTSMATAIRILPPFPGWLDPNHVGQRVG